MNPVVHFEMPAEDRTRMADFYTKAFGWKAKELGDEMGNYVVVQTSETDENGMVKNPGMINGGFFQKKPEMPAQYPSVVIAAEDIVASMKAVSDAGGKVLGEPWDIAGVGKYVPFVDTEGNRASIMQPNPRMEVHA